MGTSRCQNRINNISNAHIEVTLRCVRVTTVAVEKQ